MSLERRMFAETECSHFTSSLRETMPLRRGRLPDHAWKGSHRNVRGPTGSAELVFSGGQQQGTAGVAVRAEVGSRTGSYSNESVEGNETRGGKGPVRTETSVFWASPLTAGGPGDGRFIVKHKTEGKRLTRKLTALRQDAWRLMHAPMAAQHMWFAAVLRGHYGYYGRPHNYPALCGFHRQMRRIWLRCLRRRSQKSRRMGWSEFETLTAR